MAGKISKTRLADVPARGVLNIKEAATERMTRAAHLVKVKVFGGGEVAPRDGAPQALAETNFQSVISDTLAPPYDPYALVYIAETNGILCAAVDAFEANVESFGDRFVPQVPVDGEGVSEATKKGARDEKRRLRNFLSRVAPPGGFIKLRRDTRSDREIIGYAFWEVVRNRKDEIIEFRHIPAVQMRLCPQGEEVVQVKAPYLQHEEDGGISLEDKIIWRRFRRFVQAAYLASTSTAQRVTTSTRIVWFKEYGDPRVVDNQTGRLYNADDPEVTTDFNNTGEPMPETRRASEIIFWSRYWSRTPYGVPRWIGAILSAIGVRSAGEVNFTTLRNNNVPSLLVTVSNGRLTAATVERVKAFFDTHVRGNANYSQVLVMEGEGEFAGDETNHVKIEAKPLVDVQHTDALFTNYTKQENAILLHAFRLSPLFIGDQEAFNRATAETGRRLTDEQVFAPDRDEFDYRFNEILMREEQARYYRYTTKTPNVTDNRELAAMLSAVERTGGSTPRIARHILGDILQGAEEVSQLTDKEFNPDIPFSLTLTRALQTRGIVTEPNQTVAPVLPSGIIPGVSPGPRTLEKDLSLSMLKDLLALGDKASAELEALLGAE